MIQIFTDFDGTITRRDVGDALFERFGGSLSTEAVGSYRRGEISAAECFRRECTACGNVDVHALHAFLDAQEIDATFVEFVTFCRQERLPCTILSDGMDYYIRYLLQRHGLGEVPFKANVLEFVPVDGTDMVTFSPRFPFRDEVCDRCACCKRNQLCTIAKDDDVIVYIGEGYSDRCPVLYADVVFAKDELKNYCREENVSYYEYTSFSDITRRLRTMLANRKADGSITGLRKRWQAGLARRDVFIGG